MNQVLRFEWSAWGRPYHAARIRFAPRARDSELHTHADFHELMGVLTGSGEHLLETGTSPLVAGDVVLVRPRDRHAIRGSAPDGLEFINIAFPSSAWQGFLTLTRTNPTGSWDAAKRPIVFRSRDAVAVAATFEQALQSFADEPGHFELMRFWIDLLPQISPEELPARASGSQAPDWLTRACAAMRAEENLRGGVPRLLELAGVSPAHLSRTLRAAYGMTPTDFVTDLRLEQAAALLAATSGSIATIAGRCGFASQSYFTRRFTAAHGVSPRTFRHRAQRAFVP
ncbi:helix-turn-helix transcriptional regulator [Kribbella sp. CA-293567]|uniref:helix-turn-helix transcriptional regulator n=1 Tax=Kribbella sp. CA-293567 TaxID=3002436 RepID=UPI0022DD4EC8|nr:AraC family transcriptional regulator [Kribbella sp. CA-293567]WBQ02142.1 AraC family transcriptional regulator [Kribbella sp. CA-293567]